MYALLVLFLALPTFAARHSPLLEKEREALGFLETKFDRFQETVAETDANFERLRNAVQANRTREANSLAEELSKSIGLARRRFRDLEELIEESRRKKFQFNRITHRALLKDKYDFLHYLAFQHNNRFGHGVPLEFHFAASRGLKFGEKHPTLPGTLRKTINFNHVALRAGDSLLFMMINGGLIRGRFEGMNKESFVIREVLLSTLSKVQQRKGMYRTLDVENVARIEIIRRNPNLSEQIAPSPVVSTDGTYVPYYVSEGFVWRIHLQPTDTELLDLVKSKKVTAATFQPRTEEVKPTQEIVPSYALLFFSDCESLLR